MIQARNLHLVIFSIYLCFVDIMLPDKKAQALTLVKFVLLDEQ
jgi:hypothetical protein